MATYTQRLTILAAQQLSTSAAYSKSTAQLLTLQDDVSEAMSATRLRLLL